MLIKYVSYHLSMRYKIIEIETVAVVRANTMMTQIIQAGMYSCMDGVGETSDAILKI